MRRDLKQLQIKYDKIRGMKDEQSTLLRLADCMAGFIHDYTEKNSYALKLFELLKEKKIVIEAK